MTSDEQRLKHLEWIQSIISRQAANSFLLKGWSITLVAGMFALADKSNERSFLWLAWLPIVAFGLLDTFYLYQEKRYIELFNWVQRGQVSDAQIRQHGPFCLNPSALISALPSYWNALASPAIWVFYGPLLVASLVVPLFLAQGRGSEENTYKEHTHSSTRTTPKRAERSVRPNQTRTLVPNPQASVRSAPSN